MNLTDIEKEMDSLTKRLKTLEKKLPLYKEGENAVYSRNKLKVKIHAIKDGKEDGWIYSVCYPHLTNPQCFQVKESELEKMPDDYDMYIFNAYVDLLCKYTALINNLKGE